jgi:hypothetical protein
MRAAFAFHAAHTSRVIPAVAPKARRAGNQGRCTAREKSLGSTRSPGFRVYALLRNATPGMTWLMSAKPELKFFAETDNG